MRLKRINAILSLITIITLLQHIGYNAFSYLTFYYNPSLKLWMSMPFMVLTCLHAVCGMGAVCLQADGTRLDLYPRKNLGTIIQRLSAALIFPLLLLHLNTFELLGACAEGGKWLFFGLLVFSQPLFYGVVLAHMAVSLSRALITLGWLKSLEKKKRIDRIVYAVCLIAFAVSVFSVIKGQLAMFVH